MPRNTLVAPLPVCLPLSHASGPANWFSSLQLDTSARPPHPSTFACLLASLFMCAHRVTLALSLRLSRSLALHTRTAAATRCGVACCSNWCGPVCLVSQRTAARLQCITYNPCTMHWIQMWSALLCPLLRSALATVATSGAYVVHYVTCSCSKLAARTGCLCRPCSQYAPAHLTAVLPSCLPCPTISLHNA